MTEPIHDPHLNAIEAEYQLYYIAAKVEFEVFSQAWLDNKIDEHTFRVQMNIYNKQIEDAETRRYRALKDYTNEKAKAQLKIDREEIRSVVEAAGCTFVEFESVTHGYELTGAYIATADLPCFVLGYRSERGHFFNYFPNDHSETPLVERVRNIMNDPKRTDSEIRTIIRGRASRFGIRLYD